MTPARASRREVVRMLAGMLLATAAGFSFGQATGDEAAGKADGKGKGKGKGDKKEKAAKAAKDVVLTVVVTGDGKPVAQAKVRVKFVSGAGREITLATNPKGEAVFNLTASGTVTVRVIATGWESVLQEVALKQGPQQVALALKALPTAK